MLKNIYNISSLENLCFNKNRDVFNKTDTSHISNSVYYVLQKYFKNKKIKFNNDIFKEKKDEDNLTFFSNFLINNLLHILNQNNKISKLHCAKYQIQKKELHKKIKLNSLDFFENIKYIKSYRTEITPKVFQKLRKDFFFDFSNSKKNKFSKISNFIDKNAQIKPKDINFLTLQLKNKSNFLNGNENYINNINNEKNLVNFLCFRANKSNVLYSENVSKNYFLKSLSFLSQKNTEIKTKKNIDSLIFQGSEKSIELKKLIQKKILFAISNKNNEAEMFLEPKDLGSIYIKININNNQAILNFISNSKKIRNFLDKNILYLRNSLYKNGIKLEKVSILSSSKNEKIKKSFNAYNQKAILEVEKNKISKKNTLIDVYI